MAAGGHWLPGGLAEAGLTCGVGCLEALPLDRAIGVEAQEHAAACGQDGLGLLAPTEAAQDGGLGVTPIIYFQVVIGAFRLGLDVHLHKGLRGKREKRESGMWLGQVRVGSSRLRA